jgi:hypothetical protein
VPFVTDDNVPLNAAKDVADKSLRRIQKDMSKAKK